jgi:MFS transporter, NNP family, nitrate/nitrite transporter
MIQGLLSFQGRYRILHLTWFAFFLTFINWFNFAPFATTIGKELGLDYATQIKVLGICNLALTIPARIIIGMVLDRFGPRLTFSSLLVFSLIPCFATAFSQDFNQLVISRLLMGIVGAGFVVGIRMVSEWFPPKEIGSAEGIYGGWGNFGAFAAEFSLPLLAIATSFMAGGASNWRFAIALTGIISALYGIIYFFAAQDTPSGKVYKKPKKLLRHVADELWPNFCPRSIGLALTSGEVLFHRWNVHCLGIARRIVCLPKLSGLARQSRTTLWQETLHTDRTISFPSSRTSAIHLRD